MVGQGSPLDLNFELFFLASLSLPCPIERRGESIPAIEAVNFKTLARPIAYCTEKTEQGWGATLPPTPSQLPVTASRKLDKRTLFQRDGRVPCNGTEKEDSGINFDRFRLEDINPGLPSDWVGEAVDSNYEAWLPVSTEVGRDQRAQATAREPEGPRAKMGAQYARVQRHRRML